DGDWGWGVRCPRVPGGNDDRFDDHYLLRIRPVGYPATAACVESGGSFYGGCAPFTRVPPSEPRAHLLWPFLPGGASHLEPSLARWLGLAAGAAGVPAHDSEHLHDTGRVPAAGRARPGTASQPDLVHGLVQPGPRHRDGDPLRVRPRPIGASVGG